MTAAHPSGWGLFMERTTVLLVDDSESSLFGLGHALRDLGLQLRFAKGAAAGIQALEQERIDVVVSDYIMPVTDGIQFLEEVAARYPDTARILMTAHAGIEVAIEAINRARVHRFLQKPVDRQALRAVIEQCSARLFRERKEQQLLEVLRHHPDLRALIEAVADREAHAEEADEPLPTGSFDLVADALR
jgi:DNA-binding NtrC family response regulator